MSVGVQKAWSVTASSNGAADANVNMAEGMSPAALNDGVRAVMAAVKAFANQLGAKETGGAANAYTLTSDAPGAIDTAYAAGMVFAFKANHTNSGAATLNVDGVGATAIRKGGAESALAANDIVDNGVYLVIHNGTYWILLNPESGAIAAQPLDATLTALAALSWSSGNALVQFTAADTVSLTLTPSVSSIRASQASANPGVFINTADSAANRALRIESDRATPTNNDTLILGAYLSDSAGNQDEAGRVTFRMTDVTSGSEDSDMLFGVLIAGTQTNKAVLSGTAFSPAANDGTALGTTAKGWSDLFGASGFTLNIANGNWVLTHSSGLAEVTTGALASRLSQVSGVGGETLAAATHRNRQLLLDGDITLPNATFAAGDWHVLTADGTDRTITRGSGVTMYVNGTDSATATVPARTTAGVVWETASVCHLTGSAS